MNLIRLTGALCLLFGAITAFLAFYAPIYAMMTAIGGFLLSSGHLSLTMRAGQPSWLAYVGMLLSSTPLLLILYFTLSK